MLTHDSRRRSSLVAALVTGLMLVGGPALAGPQDDPPPPVTVTAGGPLLAGDEDTVTLTLDSAGHAGDLESGAIEAAKQAAAKVQAAGSGSTDSRERRCGRSH